MVESTLEHSNVDWLVLKSIQNNAQWLDESLNLVIMICWVNNKFILFKTKFDDLFWRAFTTLFQISCWSERVHTTFLSVYFMNEKLSMCLWLIMRMIIVLNNQCSSGYSTFLRGIILWTLIKFTFQLRC